MDHYTSIKKTLFLCSAVLALLLTSALPKSAHAQFGDAGEILKSGVEDANLLMEEYLRPFGNGFGADLNSGWINSGRPYKKFGFDLRVSAAVSLVPSGDRSFLVDELQFQNLERVGGSSETQTAFGDDTPGAVMGVFGDNPFSGFREEITRFAMPQGSGYPYVPAPMVQLTVGAVKDTDVSLRYAPSISVDEFSMDLFGFGVRHGINQWLPGGAALPVDISVQAGLTRLNSSFDLDVNPEQGTDVYNPFSATPGVWEDQSIQLEASGFTGNVIVGKNLPVISLFGGLGFQTSTVDLSSPGAYPITSFNPDFNPLDGSEETRQRIVERIDDPITLSYDGENSVHAFAGFRLRLGFIALSATYTQSKYPTLNAGVGISFR
ncbi:DUF6588 family protein [Rhodohalobacter mucosus]|uniref:Uncharacterized protein n=1 Tax=Rhodohalobacter mucosus TaxID=2079485 RepID=A0A316TWW8_9BACT|nr:DUF6588 family protein [Rhodohalobacter mucosus]PWN07064.1 hypothetical protein DDZ15_07285 [Rhodohalobacter mucosus]